MDSIASTAARVQGDIQSLPDQLGKAQQAYAEGLASGLEKAQQQYAQAQQTYAQELQSLQSELAERTSQAYRAFLETLSAAAVSAPSYQACVQEYKTYLEKLTQLLQAGDAQQQAKASCDAYASKVSSLTDPNALSEATDKLRKELESIWRQDPLRKELDEALSRYVTHVQKLDAEVRDKQVQAQGEFFAALNGIWSQPDLSTRAQGALARLVGSARDAMVTCHATVEKCSTRAIDALNGSGS